MNEFIIKDVALVLGDGLYPDSSVYIKEGKIERIGKGKTLRGAPAEDGGGLYLSPGFIDIHVHGGGGHDFMDATEEAVAGACRTHMEHGTTTIVPTSLTSEDGELDAMFRSVDNVRRSDRAGSLPYIAGVHLEGPYVSAKMAGAQDPKYIKAPTPDDWQRIMGMSRGLILIWTVAPELEGAVRMCRELRKTGIYFSAGHSAAKIGDVYSAIEAGYTMSTHLYSSMSTIIRENGYRVPGLLEASLLRDELTAEVIADGKHLPPALLQLACKTKGTDRIVLVTDAMRGAGMPDGEYLLGSLSKGQRVLVFDGIAHMPDGISFAGSVATADRLIRVMTKECGFSVPEAVKMMTANPAREIGLDRKKGRIAEGYDADLVLFDGDIDIKAVYVGGNRTV